MIRLAAAVVLLLAAALGVPAQAADKVYRIGVLDTSPLAGNTGLAAFRQRLRELGYVDGRNLVIEYRSPAGQAQAFGALADELVRGNVDVILTRGTAAVLAAKAVTSTIPIVMAASGDPVSSGAVTGLARPGGNVTGISTLATDISGKRVQLLKEAVPSIRRIAVVLDHGTGLLAQQWRATEQSARAMGLDAHLVEVTTERDLVPAMDAAVKQRADAVVVGLGPVMQNNVARLAELLTSRRLPAAFVSREFVEAGGLLAYGVSYPEAYRRAAAYVDRILRGARPGDLPIEQPTRFEFVINLKAARALGLTIPQSVVLRADEVFR